MSGEELLLLIQILYGVTAVGAMIVVISENRNPVKTISWVLILLLLPLVGLIVYYFFGEDNRKNRLISHKMYRKINKVAIRNTKVASPALVPFKFKGLIRSLEGESPVYSGNDVQFIRSGQEMFEDLFREIEKAKHHVHIEYYIFMDDNLGNALSDLLISKVKQGVEVRVIYDDVGSWKVKREFFENMIHHGVQVKAYLPVKFRWLTSRVNYRNHRKIVVIDGAIGYIGGMNIADRYVQGVTFGVWRDSQVKIRGYALAGLQSSFLLDWYSVTGKMLAEDIYYPVLQPCGNSLMQIVNGSPFGNDKLIHLGILNAINVATNSIFIQTPYFVPTDGLLLSLQLAARRGVEVKIMLPEKSDTKLVHIASRSFLEDIMRVGGEIYFFRIGFLHSKLLIVDDELTITGSANMDVRSFEHNFEIDAFIYDASVNTNARKIFFQDVANSMKLDLQVWEKRKLHHKFLESLMRLFSPLL